MSIRVDEHLNWEPAFQNEIWIIDERVQEEFTVAIKREEIEIHIDWDYGYSGRGSATTTIPLQTIKDLITKLEQS